MMRIVNRYRPEPRIRDAILARIREIEVMFGKPREPYRPNAELAASIRRLTEKNQLLLHSYIQYAEAGRECVLPVSQCLTVSDDVISAGIATKPAICPNRPSAPSRT
jgi:hypothetical protein